MKSINDKAPQYIKALFTFCPNGKKIDLDYPFHGWIYTNPIVYIFGAVISWNSLPVNIRSPIRSISLNNIKRKLINYLLSKV